MREEDVMLKSEEAVVVEAESVVIGTLALTAKVQELIRRPTNVIRVRRLATARRLE